MKRFRLPGTMLGLTALLAACSGEPTPPPTITYSLTVKLDGVASAPITVTNTTTNTQVFSGTLEGSKTFGGLKAGDVFKMEGGAVNGSTTPAAQSVTLSADKTVTLGYTSSPQAGTTLDAAHVRGTVEGWTFGTGKLAVLLAYSDNGTVAVNSPTITPAGNIDTSLPTPREVHPFLQDCTFIGERSAPDFGAQIADLLAFSTQDDYLGSVNERTSDGTRVIRVYSDTAAHFKGTAVCPGSERMELDIQVARGWNALTVTDIDSAEYRWNSRLRNLEADARTTLSFRRAGERVWMTFRDSSDLTLRRREQVTREVVLSQTGGISGEVTLETNVPGVTVTPSTVNLPALSAESLGGSRLSTLNATGATVRPQSLGTSLTFTANENAAEYSGPLEIIVKKGGEEVGRGTLYSFRLILPSVGVYIPNAHAPVYIDQGSTGSIEVYVNSNNGFNGSTTLTVTGLPQGVSTPSASVNVQVTPGTSTSVKIPLTVAADAPLSSSTVTVSSPDIRVSGMSGPTSVPLTIRPGRTAIGLVNGNAVRAGSGLWVVESYSFGSGSYQMKLVRYATNGQAAATATLAASSTLKLISLPSGDVLAVEQGMNQAAFRVDDTGATTQLTNPFSSSDTISPAADAQGRIWFVQRTYANGSHYAALAYWNPSSGEVRVVDTTRNYGYTPGSFTVSPNGQMLALLLSSGRVVRIDAASGTVTDHTLTDFAQDIVVNNAGVIWFTDGSLNRLNIDGTVTTFDGTFASRPVGFDQRNDNMLWGKDYSSVLKLDAITGEVTRISTKEVDSAVTLNGGGLAILSKETDYSGSYATYSYFLSVLK